MICLNAEGKISGEKGGGRGGGEVIGPRERTTVGEMKLRGARITRQIEGFEWTKTYCMVVNSVSRAEGKKE